MKYKKQILIRIEAVQSQLTSLRKKIAYSEITGEDAIIQIDIINKNISNALELISLEDDLGR